jgi:hypothetical protein
MNPGGGLDSLHSEQGVTVHGQLAAVGESFRGPIGASAEERFVVDDDPAGVGFEEEIYNADHTLAGVIGENRQSTADLRFRR